MQTVVHTFELAGLGKAPFKLVAVQESKHQPHPDAPAKAGSTCEYCSRAIMEVCVIQDINGKRFKVGSNCVKKTGDFGLVDTVKRAANRMKRTAQAERDSIFAAKHDAAARAYIATIPGAHPNAYYASQGKTLADYTLFTYEAMGTSSRAKFIRKHLGVK